MSQGKSLIITFIFEIGILKQLLIGLVNFEVKNFFYLLIIIDETSGFKRKQRSPSNTCKQKIVFLVYEENSDLVSNKINSKKSVVSSDWCNHWISGSNICVFRTKVITSIEEIKPSNINYQNKLTLECVARAYIFQLLTYLIGRAEHIACDALLFSRIDGQVLLAQIAIQHIFHSVV